MRKDPVIKAAASVSWIEPAAPAGAAVCAACLLLLATSSCWAQGEVSSSRHTPVATGIRVVLPQTPTTKLTVEPPAIAVGQMVKFFYALSNDGKKPMTYDFASADQADFTVLDSKGNQVWDSFSHHPFPGGISKLTIAPGNTHVYAQTWNQRDDDQRPVPAGTYSVVATLVPMPRVVVTGGFLVNPDPDPDNTGMPTRGQSESGATLQEDVSPAISTTNIFAIEPGASATLTGPTKVVVKESAPRATNQQAVHPQAP